MLSWSNLLEQAVIHSSCSFLMFKLDVSAIPCVVMGLKDIDSKLCSPKYPITCGQIAILLINIGFLGLKGQNDTMLEVTWFTSNTTRESGLELVSSNPCLWQVATSGIGYSRST